MSDTTAPEEAPPRKSSRLPLLAGLILALAGAGGGFAIVQTGLLGGSHGEEEAQDSDSHAEAAGHTAPEGAVAFVPVPAMIVSLGGPTSGRHLRFSASLEVPAGAEAEVLHLMPRVTDALNSFLQAITEDDLAARDSLLRLRVQMLHRVQLVVGANAVRDLLVAEFVLN